MANGKGDKPRRVNGPKYRDNFDSIKWNKNAETTINKKSANTRASKEAIKL